MKNLAIINLVASGVTLIGAMLFINETALGLLMIISWGLGVALAIVALKK